MMGRLLSSTLYLSLALSLSLYLLIHTRIHTGTRGSEVHPYSHVRFGDQCSS